MGFILEACQGFKSVAACGFGVFLGIAFAVTLAITRFGCAAFLYPDHFAFLLGWFFGSGWQVFANFFNFVRPGRGHGPKAGSQGQQGGQRCDAEINHRKPLRCALKEGSLSA
jgi:hypothetical protein